MHVQNFENKIILETSPKANDMIIHNIFNINLIKFSSLNTDREKYFLLSNLGWSIISLPGAVTLLFLMKTFDSMT